MENPKIIIVDDNRPILRLLEIILQKEYDIIPFLNAYKAIERIKHTGLPDLIISDIDMPYINGIEFISHVSNNRFYQSVPILILSGYEQKEILEKLPKLNFSGYMTKPFDPEILKEKIEKLLIESCCEINT